jgi:hypothetical protein
LGGQEQVLAGEVPVKNLGVLGCDFTYRDYGSQDGYDDQGRHTQAFHPYDVSVGIGWGIALSPMLSVGIRTLWFRQGALSYHEKGLLENAGILLGPWKNYKIGVTLKNIGLDSNGFSPPVEMNAGMARQLQWGEAGRHGLCSAFGLDLREHNQHRLNLGFEYAYQKMFFVRMGWAQRWKGNELGAIQGLTVGAGVSKNGWALDYALTSQAELGWVNRISIAWMPPWQKAPIQVRQAKNRLGSELPLVFPGVDKPGPLQEIIQPKVRESVEKNVSSPLSQTGDSGRVLRKSMTLEGYGSSGSEAALPTKTTPTVNGRTKDAVVLKFKLEEENDADLSWQQLYRKAEKALSEDNLDIALSCYQKCVEKEPGFEKAWIRISQIQYQKALEAAQKALKANPENESLKLWLKQH